MTAIIAQHYTKELIGKINLEWPEAIDSSRIINSNLVFLEVSIDIDKSIFLSSLMPKLGALVDFNHPLDLFFQDSEGETIHHLQFNCSPIQISA